MKNSKGIMLLVAAICLNLWSIRSEEITIKIKKRYLNFPVLQAEDRKEMVFVVDGKTVFSFNIRLATLNPDYWVFCDVSALKGKTLTLNYPGNLSGLKKIYQDDEFAGYDSLYHEKNRPQFHFTTQRGWNNDPNGLLYYEGEYHLFYQHNPYEREWENMHWGHAVSNDLIHWKELPDALYPDKIGTMFSGSAVIDYDNTAGFNSLNKKSKEYVPAMVALYTADNPEKQVQCLAYSLDKGRTWTKYKQNPIVDSRARWNSKDTRDPKVFWYKPGKHWVMVLSERDGHSIYTSSDLKDWVYRSHTTGFWECPELFELPVDGNSEYTKWVMYGASGTYMTGNFNGTEFFPEAGKYYYTAGSAYAAQTFTNIPESDGRRIQIAWGKISHPEMPFNGMMLLPTELTLRTTKDGVRLFSFPVKEVKQLYTDEMEWKSLTSAEANERLTRYQSNDYLHIQTTIKLFSATSAGLSLDGQRIFDYDMNFNRVNGVFYSPEDITSMEITADIYIDKTSIEVFVDNGAYSFSMERKPEGHNNGIRFWGDNIEVKRLVVHPMLSIWGRAI